MDLLTLRVLHHIGAELVHHGFCHLLVGIGPDVDHLVVAFAPGHETGGVLVLNFLNRHFGLVEDLFFLARDNHVFDTNGDASAGRMSEARIHELVREHDSLLETDLTITSVNQVGDAALTQDPVDQ